MKPAVIQYADGDTNSYERRRGTATGAGIGGNTRAVIGAMATIGTSVLYRDLDLLLPGPLPGRNAWFGGELLRLTRQFSVRALVGSGIPEERGRIWNGIKSGGTVLER